MCINTRENSILIKIFYITFSCFAFLKLIHKKNVPVFLLELEISEYPPVHSITRAHGPISRVLIRVPMYVRVFEKPCESRGIVYTIPTSMWVSAICYRFVRNFVNFKDLCFRIICSDSYFSHL